MEAEPPGMWQAVPETVQLEVRPAEPYSVNVWSVGVGRNLYVANGPEGSTWSSHLREHGRVRVRVAGTVYALQATLVADAEERERVATAYLRKYATLDDEGQPRPMPDALDNMSGTIYRLQPR